MSSDSPFLWVALDGLGRPGSSITPVLLQAMETVSGNWGWKVNLDTLVHLGTQGVSAHLPDHGKAQLRPRFADVKGHNGRRTLARLLEPLVEAAFTHVNFHLGECDNLKEVADRAHALDMRVLGLTRMSHQRTRISPRRVQKLAQKASNFSFDEVILPAYLASQIETELKILGTGFRPDGSDEHQPYALHPREARGLVDSVAIGSPIMQADDPVAALQQHLSWLSGN